MRNQKGFVTTEFLFAVFIAFGLTLATFALTFTLSVVEITQYITYSASRAHVAGSFRLSDQKNAAIAQYRILANNPALNPLYTNGWYEISKPQEIEVRSGNGDNFESDYAANKPRNNVQGVRTTFRAKILEMRLPLIGAVSDENDDGFSARLNAIMIREVSIEECQNFMRARLPRIQGREFDNRFPVSNATFRQRTDVQVPWEDNGC